MMFEVDLRVDGWRFRIIYGDYSLGHFIAFPNWNICLSVGEAYDVEFNAGQLRGCGSPKVQMYAERIAREVCACWKDREEQRHG